MKKALIICLIALATINVFSQGKSALFIGNSYTYYNDGVGYWVQKIANSLGDEFEYQMVAPGGYQFNQHCVYTPTLDAIALGSWDYVVLQEQSQMPSFPPEQVETEVFPYATILCDSIRAANPCTIPLFFMTWGRENGDQTNCPYYEPLCTYEGMQLRLRDSYVQMAVDNEAEVAPAGMVWKTVRDSLQDTLAIYAGDSGGHPSLLGTYLAACTFYASMFHKSPVGALVPEGLEADDVLAVQEYASMIVFDSLVTWQIDTLTVRADFQAMYLTKDIEVYGYLQNWSVNADSCYWDFGDGEFEWQYPYNPNQWDMVLHNFPQEDYYDICLTAYSGCKTDSYCETIYVFPQKIEDYTKSSRHFSIYPNPTVNNISITLDHNIEIQSIQIVDITGRTCILNHDKTSQFYDVSLLTPGFYTVIVKSEGAVYKGNFLKL